MASMTIAGIVLNESPVSGKPTTGDRLSSRASRTTAPFKGHHR